MLLAPERLEEVLASVLDRRQERTERRREHIAELNKRAAEADLRLKRLYDAIETGVADLGDPGLKERIAGLKAIRDQAQADAMRAQAALDSAAEQPITTTVLRKFAATARKRMRIEGGGYRRDHLRALAQRVEVADREVRIMGSKSDLLRTLAAITAQNRLLAAFAVLFCSGGRGGIRTHGTLAGTPVFKTGALNHSATLPNVPLMRERGADCKATEGRQARKSTGRASNNKQQPLTTLPLSPFPPPSRCDIVMA